MRTPYDAAVRVLERDMDALKALIFDASIRLDELQTLQDGFTARIAKEQRISADDWQLYACAYLTHARMQRQQLVQLRKDAEVALDQLRAQAAEQYASIKAIGGAADQFRSDAIRAEQSAEQSAMDDLSAARFVHRIREFRRSRQT